VTDARSCLEGLSNSKKQRPVIPIEQATSAEPRERRLAKALMTRRDGGIWAVDPD
jgi:hypothetical protein